MRSAILVRLMLVCLCGALVCILVLVNLDDPPQRPAVTEDDPGWDCHTQGNRVCGP